MNCNLKVEICLICQYNYPNKEPLVHHLYKISHYFQKRAKKKKKVNQNGIIRRRMEEKTRPGEISYPKT